MGSYKDSLKVPDIENGNIFFLDFLMFLSQFRLIVEMCSRAKAKLFIYKAIESSLIPEESNFFLSETVDLRISFL